MMLAALGLLLGTAQAADWLSIQGLEPAEAEAARLRPTGFLQVAAEGVWAEPVTGLTAESLQDYEGELASFNTLGVNGERWGLGPVRARVGGRGALPGADGRLDAFVAVELGRNAITTTATDGWRPALMDASVTLAGPVNLRVGQFKLPLSDEALEAVHLTNPQLRFTRVTSTLLMERDTSTGAFTGRINGLRGAGAQAFGSHLLGPTELSWAVMASQAWVGAAHLDPGMTWTGRAQLAWLLDGRRRSPWREELAAWGFVSTGLRDVGEADPARRTRVGGGAQLNTAELRLRAEGIYADGVLNVGMSPPFAGGSVGVDPEGQAWGVTALATWRPVPRWELGALYGHLDSRPEGGPDRRVFDDVTGVARVNLVDGARLDLNLGWRHGRAPEGSADAVRVLETMGPVGSLTLTAWR
ncbi:MAG: hypothetical protein H6741_02135 [Alphaproteobacteria bacterium]|nr:hypothetical protein [Alphaproteobacteria bacterium]MCB9791502.1 hypothetical protein [Alphaproteobacteria bacterium]